MSYSVQGATCPPWEVRAAPGEVSTEGAEGPPGEDVECWVLGGSSGVRRVFQGKEVEVIGCVFR